MALRTKSTNEKASNKNAAAQEDMKIVKFKAMVKEIDRYLVNYPLLASAVNDRAWEYEESERPDLFHCGLYLYTCPSKEICRFKYIPLFLDKYRQATFIENLLSEMGNVCYEEKISNDVMKVIKAYDDCKTTADVEEITEPCVIGCYRLIFWLLFMAAINDDIYNNELSGIIDLAYCLDFDEHMIKDWCRAVEYALSGNHLNEKCDLQCDTVEGAIFFLHDADEIESEAAEKSRSLSAIYHYVKKYGR